MYTNGNLTLMVRDFEAALHFYHEQLGLNLRVRYGDDWAELEAPGLTIGLHPAEDAGEPSPRASVGLQVADIQDAVASLRDRGVTFTTDIEENDHLRIIHLHDPEGNGVYLTQPKH